MNEIIYTKGFKLLDRFNQKYDNISSPNIEDIISDTCLGLSAKITMFNYNKYDTHIFILRVIKKKTKKIELKLIENINGFIFICIDNACKRHLTRRSTNKNLLSIDDIDIPEPDNNSQEQITQEELINNLLFLINKLSEKDQYFIRWWMMKHKTIKEVAEEWDIQPHSVYKSAKRALEKLNKLYHKK